MKHNSLLTVFLLLLQNDHILTKFNGQTMLSALYYRGLAI